MLCDVHAMSKSPNDTFLTRYPSSLSDTWLYSCWYWILDWQLFSSSNLKTLFHYFLTSIVICQSCYCSFDSNGIFFFAGCFSDFFLNFFKSGFALIFLRWFSLWLSCLSFVEPFMIWLNCLLLVLQNYWPLYLKVLFFSCSRSLLFLGLQLWSC